MRKKIGLKVIRYYVRKCAAKLSMIVKPGMQTIKSRNVYKFSKNIDDSTMLKLTNYGEFYHDHRNCQDIRNAGSCRMSRYEGNCFKKVVKTLNAIIVKKTSVQQAKQHLSNCEYKFQLNNGRTKTETT